MGKVKAIPDGYHTVTPYLVVRNAAQAIGFYTEAFGAKQTVRMDGPNGKVMHAEIRIGDSVIMIGDENPQRGSTSPETLNGSAVRLMLYCENVDQAFERAVQVGAKALSPPADLFWGDRIGYLVDPFGHKWALQQHVRDLSPEEMRKAQEEWMKQHSK
jgi:PhnB protein